MKEEKIKPEKSNIKKNALKVFGVVLSIIVLWYMISAFIKNWADIKPYLSNIKIGWFVFSVLIYAIVFLLTGLNWSLLLYKMDKSAKIKEYLNIHMVSALARYIPGGVWNIVGKAYMCNMKGVKKSAITVSMILEYVFQIISSGLFILFFIPVALRKYIGDIGIVLAVIGIVVALICMPYLINIGIRIVAKLMKSDCEFIKLEHSYIYRVLLRYVGVWIITGLGLVTLVYSFADIDLLQSVYLMLSYPISWVAGFLSPSPNGMGVREGLLGILLGESYKYELVLLVTLTSRIWTIIGEIVSFLSFELYYFIRKDVELKESE